MGNRILLTGGSGDLGLLLARALKERDDEPVNLDVRPPAHPSGTFVHGSILDRPVLNRAMTGVDTVVHIAAWHGIHEVTGQKDVYEFWELNVTGTTYVFEAAARAGVKNVVYVSSTSVRDRTGVYGHTKVLGEEIAHVYAKRHELRVITLRPRAFIPHWNRTVYNDYIEWARWFWPGAVHIDDVLQATTGAVDLLASESEIPSPLVLTVDGAYDFSADELAAWDQDGPGTTFQQRFPDYVELVARHGLDSTRQPRPLEMAATRRWLGYHPRFSIGNLLRELAEYGAEGPPPPF